MNIIFKSSRRAVTAAIIASLMGIFNACHRHGHGAAEHHMHRHNFDELVKHFEDPARDQWWTLDLGDAPRRRRVVLRVAVTTSTT